MTSITRKLVISTAVAFMPYAHAASAPILTLAQEMTAIAQTSTEYKVQATDPVQMVSMTDPTLDKAFCGPAIIKNNSATYFSYDGTNLFANALIGTVWKTFSLAPAASYAGTTTLLLNESIGDGLVIGSPTYKLQLQLTATGSPAALTKTQLGNYLAGSSTNILSSAGTTPLSGTNLPAGWNAVVTPLNNVTPMNLTLSPEAMTASWAITPYNGSAVTYNSNISNLHTWNLAVNDTTQENVDFSLSTGGSSAFSINAVPGSFGRSNGGIGNAFIYWLGNLPAPRLFYDANNPNFYNLLASAVTQVRSIISSGASSDTQTAINAIMTATHSPFFATNFITNAAPTQDGSNYSALVALTSANIQSITWAAQGSQIIASGQVGASGMTKNFMTDLAGYTLYDTTSGAGHIRLLAFQSQTDSDMFFAWSLIANGSAGALDASSDPVRTADKPKMLAMRIVNQLNAIASITALDFTTIVAAASH